MILDKLILLDKWRFVNCHFKIIWGEIRNKFKNAQPLRLTRALCFISIEPFARFEKQQQAGGGIRHNKYYSPYRFFKFRQKITR
jgi:hypothetical protein